MQIAIESPIDMHLHLRDNAMLRLAAPLSAETFAGAVVMPNLLPPVTDAAAMEAYARRIGAACGPDFRPWMTLFLKDQGERELLAARSFSNFFGLKLYPAGVTTNSGGGVLRFDRIGRTLAVMQEMGVPLLVHGESRGFVMDREREFLAVYRSLAEQYPGLTISMEHITTAAALRLLDEYENLVATVTLQHLLFTLDDLAGGLLRPELFCKPVVKRPEDREALCEAALNGHPRLMFGSDSAPHPRSNKECLGCAAGVFTAPFALQRLAGLFAEAGRLENLQAFVSGNARRIYGFAPPVKRVVLTDVPFHIPALYRGFGESVIPMGAGEWIPWSVSAPLPGASACG
ncbi:MAG: dihydroorotase [Akkermansiaceae bacterium]|nr:dihydroorotase [Akkermansiaceae bacterium]